MQHAVHGAIQSIEAKLQPSEGSATTTTEGSTTTTTAAAGGAGTADNEARAAPDQSMAAGARQDEAALYDALGVAAPVHGQHRFRDAEEAGKAIPSTFE